MIDKIVAFIENDYKENKIPFLIESVGVPVNIAAAVMIAVDPIGVNFVIAYILFLIASILIMAAAYIRDNPWILFLNFIFFLINIIGIINSI